ncbi:glycoside hydrolase family 71 protein [Trametes meyenii]|nr:glycoside hydrolase family 71 protein [Trametes meyenii]
MVGNTYPYSLNDWREDIELASSHGIDGFALNSGAESWQKERVADCYAAALRCDRPFRLFLNFDIASIPASRPEDVTLLRDYIKAFAYHPRQLKYKGKVLVSTFAGQDSLFGQCTLHDAWDYVKNALQEIAPLHFIPSFFINPQLYPTIRAMDGYFNWNGSWPIHLTPDSPRDEVVCAKLETDRHHLHHLGGRTFMAAISPWFFTHYGVDSWNKNWIYRSDDWLYVRRWEQLIAMRNHIGIVQIISWNDFGESHYIGPIKGAQPNSQSWVDGFPHTAWLDLTRYFARAFKDGVYPPIERDKIYMWSRPHLKSAEAVNDPIGRPDRWQLTDDTIWVVAFATGPAEVRIHAGDNLPPQSWKVDNGVWKLSHPMVPGEGMKATMVRAGTIVAQCAPGRDEFVVQERPETYNFNVFVAMSP